MKRHGYPQGGLRSEHSVQAAPVEAAQEEPVAAQAADAKVEKKAAPEKKKGGRPKKADAKEA